MAVLKPLILLSSIMPTFTTKSTNGMTRFNFSTIISIALLSVFLCINIVYSSPPALPPPLPNAKSTDQSDKTTIDDPDALLKGINQFMDSREPDIENTIKPLGDSKNQADSFIDFSNDKLPPLEGDKPDTQSDVKTPDLPTDLPTDLPKQQEITSTTIVDTKETQPAKTPNTDIPSPKLPPLPAPSSGNVELPKIKASDNIALPKEKVPGNVVQPEVRTPDNTILPEVKKPDNIPLPEAKVPGNVIQPEVKTPDNTILPEVKTPDNIPLPEVKTPSNIAAPEEKAPDNIPNPKIQEQNSGKNEVLLPIKEPIINKEPIDEDEITIPTLDAPLQENNKPSFTPIVPPVNVTKSEESRVVDTDNTTKTPIETTLPNASDTDQIEQTEKDQLKPTTSTPVPIFVQEPTPVEPDKKDSNKQDENKNVQEAKIAPNKPQEKINIPTSKKNINVTVKNNPANASSSIKSQEVLKFAKDETQMLLLPNDDVVLGVLTDEAKLEQMDMYKFIKIAKQSYDRENQVEKRQLIENFINSYDNNLRPIKSVVPENLTDITFDSVKKNNLFVLRTLLDNYPVLQRRGENNYTLLHEAAESDNYYMAKFLIIRGININAVDYQYRTALDIAQRNNNNVSCIIKKALGR